MPSLLFRSYFIILMITFSHYVQSKDNYDWKLMHGNLEGSQYRYAEQYGVRKNLLGIDNLTYQRLDFTFSKKHQWEMYFTTSLLSGSNDQILLHIDDHTFSFEGQGCCHKQAFTLDAKTVRLLKNAKRLSVEEVYYEHSDDEKPWFHYKSFFKTNGLNEALEWAEAVR